MSQVRPETTAGSPREDASPIAPQITRGDHASPGRVSGQGHHGMQADVHFARLVGWLLLGTVVPGLGLILAGRRTAGRLVFGIFTLALLACGAVVLWGRPVQAAARTLASPDKLLLVVVGLGALAAAWTGLVLVTYAVLRRQATLSRVQQALTVVLVTALALVGVIPVAKAASYGLVARDTVRSVFTTDGTELSPTARRPVVTAVDPWADVPRVNVLLIGSDAGRGREGTRPDTLIVASIDTATGDTVLLSLPRNLQRVPFPPGSRAAAAFPHGFYCINPQYGVNTDCLLNSVWTWAESNKAQFYPGVKEPGLTATVQAVEQVLGLQIDDYVMLDLTGFIVFVDARGGVRVNVSERLPIGGTTEDPVARYGWIEPGRDKLLDGWDALWFARSRWSTSDYDRMRRQRCVIAAVTRQADPQTVALNFDKIARAAKDNLSTDISLQDLDAWVTLALRVKHARVRSLTFTDDVIDTAHPDFATVHSLVKKALRAPSAEPQAAPTPSRTPNRSSTPGPTGTPAPSRALDVDQVC